MTFTIPMSEVLGWRQSIKSIGVTILIALTCVAGFAQAPDPAARPDRGTRPVGSYSISDIESINLQNGNLSLSIPLATLPAMAGGKLSFTVAAHYNSKNWDMKSYENEADLAHNSFWTAQQIDLGNTGGWRVGGAYAIYQRLADSDFVPFDPGCTGGLACAEKAYRYKFFLITPDGSEHELRPIDFAPGATQNYRIGFYEDRPTINNQGVVTQPMMRYYSFDGSYLYARIDPFPINGSPISWDVYLPDGTRVSQNANAQKITDTNGNQIKIFSETHPNGTVTTHYQDLVSLPNGTREILVTAPTDSDPPTQVTYQTVGGAPQIIDIAWADTHVEQLYNIDDRVCPDVLALLSENVSVIKSITLPQTELGQPRKQFQFFYNSEATQDTINLSWRSDCSAPFVTKPKVSHGWGSLSEMDTPDGAMVRYSYLLDGNSTPARGLKGAKKAAGETITQKQIEQDGVIDTWTYLIAQGAGANTASVTGPDGSVTTENFYPHDPALAGSIGGGDGKGGLVYRTTTSNKQIVERHWKPITFDGGDSATPGGQAPFNPVVDAEYTTLLDASGNPSKMLAKTMQYDFNGNMISETDYDWIDLSQATVPRDAQGVPTSFPGTTILRSATNSYYNAASTSAAVNYAKRDATNVTPSIVNALKETIAGASDTRLSYDNQTYGIAPIAGNLTDVGRLKSGTTFIHTTYGYDSYGNRVSVTDPNQNVTDFTIDPLTHAQPTEIKVYPDRLNTTIFHKTTIVYDYSMGAVISQTDPNGKTTTQDYRNHSLTTNPASPVNDPFLRPGLVTDPSGRKVLSFYHDSLRQVESKADLKIADDALLKSMSTHDKLGRVTKVESSENGTSYSISSQTLYKNDPVSKVSITKSSNPTRGDGAPTDGWTRTTKDDLGRVIEVATFSGSAQPPDAGCVTNCTGTVMTSYDREYTTVTDQAGKQRRSRVDALGRLVRVDEPTTAGLGSLDSPNQKTDYTYDSRGNLTLVTQGTQTRTFTYDNLNRLTQARNPEQVNQQGQQAAAIYDYDNASNLTLRTNPNGRTVGFSYDGLNRAKTKTLTVAGSPAIWNYTYDTATNGKGRLASVVLNGSTDGYYYDSYDASGRVIASRQITSAAGVAQGYSMGYAYDVSGNMTSETYPSGKVIETEYDAAGRIAGVKRQANGMYYAGGPAGSSAIFYAAHGAVTSMRLGSGRIERTTFNSRLQPTQIALDSNTVGVNTLQLDYDYGTTTNNGNVLSQTITVSKSAGGNLVLTQNYTYDALNRLGTAEELIGTTSQWKQTYDYDRWGNRAVRNTPTSTYIPNPRQTPISNSAADLATLFNQTTNRIAATTDYGYDNAGNLTSMPNKVQGFAADTMGYDAENRQIKFNSATQNYFYDGDGRRVKKIVGNDTTVFVYNVAGQLIAEYTSGTPAAGDTSYLTTDHLGSTRLVTDSGGNVKARYDYLPFGEEIGANIGSRSTVIGYAGTDSTKQKFTQKERDNESGLDYFGARYYGSPQGRFTSTDPNPVTKENFVNPQRWNLYVYVNNNPLAAIDPNGGDGEGKGGDKVITVFLVMSNNDRNTMTQGGKTSVVGAPNWNATRDSAARNGYDLQLFGSSDVAGKGASPPTPEAFEGALKNSQVVVYVDHGVGDTNNVPFIPTFIEVGDKGYYGGGTGKVVEQNGNRILSPTGDKPEASASVICNFSCNSSANSDFFNNKGTGQRLVTINSGKDGLTTVGTLERAANAFINAYAQGKGSTDDRIKAGVNAANKVIREDRRRKVNEGDTVESRRVN